jgi:hypothetical protein
MKKKPSEAVSEYMRALGRKGGKARAARLTPEERSAQARKANAALLASLERKGRRVAS